MVFSIVVYRCESWTIKKAEHQRIDVFELWSWRRLLRVPWTARRSNQSILKKISPEYALEGQMLKLKLPILWPPDAKSWLIGKDSDAGGDWGQEKGTTEDKVAGWHHRLNGHEFEWTLGVGDGQGGLACCDSWGRKESDTTEQLNWTKSKDPLSGVYVDLTWLMDTFKGSVNESESKSRSVVSDSLQSHGLYSPWKSPGQNPGIGSCSLLQGIFPTQRLNPGLLHCRWIFYQLSHQGNPCEHLEPFIVLYSENVSTPFYWSIIAL